MRLEDYLAAISECPDEIVEVKGLHGKNQSTVLTEECGVYDNFSILLRVGIRQLVYDLIARGYHHKETCPVSWDPRKTIAYMASPNKEIVLQIMEGVYSTSQHRIPNHELPSMVNLHINLQENLFTTEITLHPGFKGRFDTPEAARKYARVVLDIGRYTLENGILLCMPQSYGNSHYSPLDTRRIAYFLPKKVELRAPNPAIPD